MCGRDLPHIHSSKPTSQNLTHRCPTLHMGIDVCIHPRPSGYAQLPITRPIHQPKAHFILIKYTFHILFIPNSYPPSPPSLYPMYSSKQYYYKCTFSNLFVVIYTSSIYLHDTFYLFTHKNAKISLFTVYL